MRIRNVVVYNGANRVLSWIMFCMFWGILLSLLILNLINLRRLDWLWSKMCLKSYNAWLENICWRIILWGSKNYSRTFPVGVLKWLLLQLLDRNVGFHVLGGLFCKMFNWFWFLSMIGLWLVRAKGIEISTVNISSRRELGKGPLIFIIL